jgi:hypothetical protein
VVASICVLRYHLRQNPRPENEPATIVVSGPSGNALSLTNPPGTFLAEDKNLRLLRAIALGFDPTLCPDGRVIGPVADQKYEMYSDEEKKQFAHQHRIMVQGIREQARGLLNANIPPLPSEPLAPPPSNPQTTADKSSQSA